MAGTDEPKLKARERLVQAVARYLEDPATETIEVATAGEAGSAGKTTTAVTFAALFAQAGFQVEVVDLDGQGNASKHLGIGTTIYPDDNLLVPGNDLAAPLVVGDALLGRRTQFPGESTRRVITLDDVRRSAYNANNIPGYGVITDDPECIEWLQRIHVYPNGPSYVNPDQVHDFYEDEAELSKNPFAGMVLSQQVDQVSSAPHVRIYDLHGTKSISMMSALVRVRRVINCVGLDDKTTGIDLDHLKATIESVHGFNAALELAMVLPCRVKAASQRGRHGHQMLERLRQRHGKIVPDVEIRETVTVNEAYTNREPLPMWVPSDPVTDDYRHALAWAFENGIFR